MELGHFQYLLSGNNPNHTKVASERLEMLAKTAAKRYVEDGTPLNTTIKKQAEENDLNVHQVERVCEMANIATHQALWPKTASKDKVSFDVADAKEITGGTEKTAAEESDTEGEKPKKMAPCPPMSDSDYAGPPKGVPGRGPSLLSLLGADPEKVHNGLGPEPEKKRIIIVLKKKAAERDRIKSDLLYKGMELESLEKKAYQAVKQTILGGESFPRLLKAAASAGFEKEAREYLPEWEKQLRGEVHGSTFLRLEKQAISRAPQDLISDDMGNVAVANGAHPVMVSLDTIKKKTGEVKNGIENLLRIEDEIKVNSQKLRELS